MKKVCVIGSFNIDISCVMQDFPAIGETIFTDTWDLFVGGGKGGNQAVALGKLGADVRMVGKLGDKFYGPEYLQVLKKHNIKCDTVAIEKDTYPGCAFVGINKNSDNILFVYSGANMLVKPDYIRENREKIFECDIFLMQLEIPFETNLYAARELKGAGKTVILDPAPARRYEEEIFQYVDYATPNEVGI